jgi:hypothetical protein
MVWIRGPDLDPELDPESETEPKFSNVGTEGALNRYGSTT